MMSIELASRGYEVTAVDCTPTGLEVGKQLSQMEQVPIRLVEADIRQWIPETPVDAVLLWDVIFGIFGSKQDHYRLLSHIANMLKPAGTFLLECYNKESAIQNGIEDTYFYNPLTDSFESSEGQNKTISSLILFTDDDFNEMFSQAGFEIISRDGWRFSNDPQTSPWRANYIVGKKIGY